MPRLLALLDRSSAVAGCEINDDPFAPICRACRQRARRGDGLPPGRAATAAGEKLATPDVSMADLIGEIDPIRWPRDATCPTRSHPLGSSPHPPRHLRHQRAPGPDRKGPGRPLLNVMEEDVQIKGYKIRLPLDVVPSHRQPQDYTSRGAHHPRLSRTASTPRSARTIQSHRGRDRDHGARGAGAGARRARGARPRLHQGAARADHDGSARVERDQPVLGRQRTRDDQQLRERHRQRREACRSLRRARDRPAPHRPARRAVVDGGQDRARVCRQEKKASDLIDRASPTAPCSRCSIA